MNERNFLEKDISTQQHPTTSPLNLTFSSAMLEAKEYNKWVLNYYTSYIKDPLLEIGLGHGAFYSYLPSTVNNYTGIDIDETLVNHAKNQNPHNQYLCMDLASKQFIDYFKGQKFNSIICFNVLEHISDDKMALKNMINVLTTSGHILLFVPAFQTLYTDLDRLAGHYRRYHFSTLDSLVKICGGEIAEWSYFNFIGGIGWWVNKFMKHHSLNDHTVNKQIWFFNKFILPFSKIIQPFTKKFFGQSLYCVIRKKSK